MVSSLNNLACHLLLISFEDCGCNLNGVASGDTTCDKDEKCTCAQGYGGKKCFECADGYYMSGGKCTGKLKNCFGWLDYTSFWHTVIGLL